MPKKISKEMIIKIRTSVLNGKTKYSIAKELGIGITTVYRHTKDILYQKQSSFDEYTIKKIRNEVLMGKSKYQIAKENGLKFGAVYYHTQDLPNKVFRKEGIQGEVLDLLKELLNYGYVFSTGKNGKQIRRLKKYLPMIQRSQIDGRSIYYLLDKNKAALNALIQNKRSRVYSYQELKEISNVFDVKLSNKEKKSVLSQKYR